MKSLLLLALASLAVPSFACVGNGCGGAYDFRRCRADTCHSGNYIGYGCIQGVCPFVCYGIGCNGFGVGGYIVPQPKPQNYVVNDKAVRQYAASPVSVPNSPYGAAPNLYSGWGYGAYGHQGCLGNNCGYWSGCQRGTCGGFYDFRMCSKPRCNYGSYHGYGCNQGSCQFICHRGQCHSAYGYGHGCSGDHCGMPYALQDCFNDNCGYDYNCHDGHCDKYDKYEEREEEEDEEDEVDDEEDEEEEEEKETKKEPKKD